MRIGECADLSCDCLRSTGPKPWAIHVPLGKLKTEPMVPVDSFVGELVQRLAFFSFLDPLPADDGSSPVHAPKKRGFVHCVITCSGLPCPRPLLRIVLISFVILMPQRCFEPV